ncbi:hypothetical protein OG242_25285 [Streptomyces sp. NBC_00727]|uniref:hypothetical protein n=1 Tax=Streptomyces sp. NBC_00727 TaxID=2903675 RepID=UPI0038642DC9
MIRLLRAERATEARRPSRQVTFIDWERKRAFVEPVDGGGIAKWSSGTVMGLSHALTRATRAVLLGSDPVVSLTRRGTVKRSV